MELDGVLPSAVMFTSRRPDAKAKPGRPLVGQCTQQANTRTQVQVRLLACNDGHRQFSLRLFRACTSNESIDQDAACQRNLSLETFNVKNSCKQCKLDFLGE